MISTQNILFGLGGFGLSYVMGYPPMTSLTLAGAAGGLSYLYDKMPFLEQGYQLEAPPSLEDLHKPIELKPSITGDTYAPVGTISRQITPSIMDDVPSGFPGIHQENPIRLVPTDVKRQDVIKMSAPFDALRRKNIIVKGTPDIQMQQNLTRIIPAGLNRAYKPPGYSDKISSRNVILDRKHYVNRGIGVI